LSLFPPLQKSDLSLIFFVISNVLQTP